MGLRTVLWSLALLLVLLVGTVAGAVLPRLSAIRALQHFRAEVPGDRKPEQEPPVGWIRIQDPEGFGVRRLWVRSPPGPGPHPCLIFVHGVAPVGIDDGRILRAVEAFHRGGFCVVAPELRFMVDPTVRDDDDVRMGKLLRAIAAGRIEQVDPQRLGVVGISVGGGFALKACARWLRDGGSGLAAVLCIGTPDDIRRPARQWYALPNPDPAGGSSFAWQKNNVAAFARNYGARAALRRRFGQSPDAAVLAQWLRDEEVPAKAPDGLASAEARAFADLLLAGPEALTAAGDEFMRDAWDQLEAFSPADWADELEHLRGVPIYLLHGHGDPLVPIAELEPLRQRLAEHTLVSVLESHLVGHTTVGDVGISEQLEHVVFMSSFFGLVRR